MSKYPIWWDTSITIYNKYIDPTTQIITWYRTNLDNCFWKYTRNSMLFGESVLETVKTICRIPQNVNFMEKQDWINLPSEDKATHFTLSEGDIVVKGHIEDDIQEYTRGQRATDLISKYKALQGCMVLNQFSNNTGSGRTLPHYYIVGD